MTSQSTSNLIFTIIVFISCVFNVYYANAEFLKHNNDLIQNIQHDLSNEISESEKYDENQLNSVEYDLSDLQNHDILAKLRALELLLNNLKQHKDSASVPNKRGVKDTEKKRPGWELAFGKRKRSLEKFFNTQN